jgi:hypothetical protein
VVPDSDTRFPALDRDAAKAKRGVTAPLRPRRVTVGAKTYVSVSAHELLEHLSETEHHAYRPGYYL